MCVLLPPFSLFASAHPLLQRFDQGPSLLLLPEFFHETFADLNTTMANEGLRIVKCEPNYKVYFDDGECITLTSDLAQMKDEIERWEGRDGFQRSVRLTLSATWIRPLTFDLRCSVMNRYLGFLQESHRHYEISAQHVLHKNFTSLLHLARPSFLRYLISLHPFESIVRTLNRILFTCHQASKAHASYSGTERRATSIPSAYDAHSRSGACTWE